MKKARRFKENDGVQRKECAEIARYCGTPGWAAFGRLASTCCT